jgi:hypothetical protein
VLLEQELEVIPLGTTICFWKPPNKTNCPASTGFYSIEGNCRAASSMEGSAQTKPEAEIRRPSHTPNERSREQPPPLSPRARIRTSLYVVRRLLPFTAIRQVNVHRRSLTSWQRLPAPP